MLYKLVDSSSEFLDCRLVLEISAFLFAAPSDWRQPGGLDFFVFFVSRQKRK
jgi:hypothetical protein